jgi:hypothetical protein
MQFGSYDNGFAGIIYLHDMGPDGNDDDIQQDLELISKLVGPDWYDRNTLVMNKYTPAARCTTIGTSWRQAFKHQPQPVNNAEKPGDNPKDIVEWKVRHYPLYTLALAKELVQDKKILQKTKLGKAYATHLDAQIKRAEANLEQGPQSQRNVLQDLKNERDEWKKSNWPTPEDVKIFREQGESILRGLL